MTENDVTKGQDSTQRDGAGEELLNEIVGDSISPFLGSFEVAGDELIWTYHRSRLWLVVSAFFVVIAAPLGTVIPVPSNFQAIVACVLLAIIFFVIPMVVWTVRFKRPNQITLKWRFCILQGKSHVIEPVNHIQVESRGSSGEGFGERNFYGLKLEYHGGSKRLPGSAGLDSIKRTQKHMLDWLNTSSP